MTRLRCFSLGLLILVLTGCDLGGQKTPPSEAQSPGATFQVLEVAGQMETDQVHPTFETPVARNFNFSACVVDNLYQRPVGNQPFSIWREGEVVARDVSDEKGCVHWQERVPFEYFGDSRYLLNPRSIRGEAASRGEVLVPLAINPWLHGEPDRKAVYDTRFARPNAMDSSTRAFVASRATRLWIEELELRNIREAGGKFAFLASLHLRPMFLARNVEGSEVHVPVPAGVYDAEVTLYVQNGQSVETLDQVRVSNAKARGGRLDTEIRLAPARVPSVGVYRLGLKLSPVKGPAGLEAFEGSFDLGSVEEFTWSGQVRGALGVEVAKNPLAYSLDFLANGKPLKREADQGAYYVTKELRCLYDGIAKEDSVFRTINFRITACLKRRDNQRPRQGVTVDVVKNDGSRATLETNEQGCVDFEDHLSHNYFEPECRHRAAFRVSNAQIGIDEEVPLQINPWESGLATFCRDARILEAAELRELNNRAACVASKPRAEYFVDTFDASEQKVDYTVDDALNLIVVKTMRFGLNPRVKRWSSQTQGRNMVEPLRPGLYLVRWALIRNGYEDPDREYEFIDGGEVIGRVANGRFTHDFDVHLRDRRLIDSRNRVLFEFHTIDESKVEETAPGIYRPKQGWTNEQVVFDAGIAPSVFDAPIEMRATTFVSMFPFNLARLDGTGPAQLKQYAPWIEDRSVSVEHKLFPPKFENLGQLIGMGREIERLEKSRQASLKDAFAEMQDLTPVTEATPVSEQLTYERMLPQLREQRVDGDLYRDLCRYWVDTMIPAAYRGYAGQDTPLYNTIRNKLRGRCLSQRSDWFASVELFRFLGARHNPFLIFQSVLISEEASFREMARENRSFMITMSSEFTVASRWSIYAEAGWRAPLAQIPGAIGQLGGAFHIFSQWRRDQGNDIGFRSTGTLNAEENTMYVDLKRYRQCWIVRMNAAEADDRWLGMVLRQAPEVVRGSISQAWRDRGLLVCDQISSEPRTIAERYYYIANVRPPGTQQDPTDIRNRFYSIGLRSERDFLTFMSLGKGQMANPDVTDQSFNGYGAWKAGLDQAFRGLAPASPGVYLESVFY